MKCCYAHCGKPAIHRAMVGSVEFFYCDEHKDRPKMINEMPWGVIPQRKNKYVQLTPMQRHQQKRFLKEKGL